MIKITRIRPTSVCKCIFELSYEWEVGKEEPFERFHQFIQRCGEHHSLSDVDAVTVIMKTMRVQNLTTEEIESVKENTELSLD